MPNVFDRIVQREASPSPSSSSRKSGGSNKSVFDRVINKKEETTEKESEDDFEAKKLIETERNREPRLVKAAARAAAVGLGTYGDLGSLLPGRETGSGNVAPGEQAKIGLEAKALESGDENEFAKQIIANAAESDLAPTLSTAASSKDIDKFLNQLGIKKEESHPAEQLAGRLGRIFSSTASTLPGIGTAASIASTSATAGQIAQEMGFGETGQTVAEVIGGLRFQGLRQTANQTGRIRQPRIVTRGQHAEHAGEVSARRVGTQLNRVNQEAADIARNIGANNRPFQNISRAIERGEPIAQNFERFFTQLENITYRFNAPLRDVGPLNNFIANEMRLYQGTGAPTFMSNLITRELQGWAQHGQNGLYNVFRRYRLNNQRIREIIADPNFPPAFRNQAIGFFTRMNEAIGQSFTASLPQDSRWLQAFTQSNSAYSNYMNTLAVRRVLQPLYQGNLSARRLQATLDNPRFWENVERFLGADESGNLRTLLTDLQTARNGLQSMRRSPGIWRNFLRHVGISSLVGRTISSLFNLPHAMRWARGMYYSSPEFGRSLGELSRAIAEQNIPAMVIAAKAIAEQQEESKKKKNQK